MCFLVSSSRTSCTCKTLFYPQCESVQLQTVLALYERETDRNLALPRYERLKTMAKRHMIHQKFKTKKKRNNNRDSEDRLRDLPERLAEFTENLEYTEVSAHAHLSHDSDSERPTKVAPRKRSIYIHFPENRTCEVCLRSNMTTALAEDALAKHPYFVQESLVA